jgi:hypothetical protein
MIGKLRMLNKRKYEEMKKEKKIHEHQQSVYRCRVAFSVNSRQKLFFPFTRVNSRLILTNKETCTRCLMKKKPEIERSQACDKYIISNINLILYIYIYKRTQGVFDKKNKFSSSFTLLSITTNIYLLSFASRRKKYRQNKIVFFYMN